MILELEDRSVMKTCTKKLPKRAQELKPNEIKLLDVHGNEIETIGTITLEMDFEGKIITQDLIVRTFC